MFKSTSTSLILAGILVAKHFITRHPLRGVDEGARVGDRHKVAQMPQLHPPLGAR
jgi:hypothetical protein